MKPSFRTSPGPSTVARSTSAYLALLFSILAVTTTSAQRNQAPVARNDGFTVNEDTTLSVSPPGVLANDTDANQDPLTAILVSGTANGTLSLNANGGFTYTPVLNFNGTDSFTYRANDGSRNSDVATVVIVVNPVNDRPVAVNDSYTMNEDEILAVGPPGVLVNDSDVDGDRLRTGTNLFRAPSNGSVTMNSDGSFVYFPQSNFNGTDLFIYRVQDGQGGVDFGLVTITLLPVNDRPVVTNRTIEVAFNDDRVFRLFASDVDGDPLTISIVTPPGHGTLIGGPDLYRYTADTGFIGTDTFTYRANDGRTNSNTATVTVLVKPVITVSDAAVQEGGPFAVFGKFLQFRVTLTPAVSFPVPIQAETRNGTALSTATAGLAGDYVALGDDERNFTLPAGQTVTIFLVSTVGDALFEPDETLTFRVTSDVAIVTRTATGTILNDDINIGETVGLPPDVTARVGERVDYTLQWTHPERWRLLDTIDVRISDDGGEVLTVRFSEPNNTFSLYDPSSNKFLRPAEPGSRTRFETSAAILYLADTFVFASGPTDPAVLLNLNLGFKPQAAGRILRVEAFATDDNGYQKGFDPVGTITVLPR